MGKIRLNSLPPEGDLPDPVTLAAYKEISPETLKTILDVFVAEAVHQRKLDDEESIRKTQALEAQIAFARRGQIFGLLIGMTAIICGAVTAALGHEWAGSVNRRWRGNRSRLNLCPWSHTRG